jgi:hypothetical protein
MLIALAAFVCAPVSLPSISPPPVGCESNAARPSDTAAPELELADWTAIRAAYDAHRHAAVADDEGFRARNPGQSWTARFDGRGVTTRPDHGGWTWGLELASYGFAGALRSVSLPAQTCAQGERVEYDWDSTLTEWYVNEARGLEHGYTVHERPQGGEGELMFTLRVRGELEARVGTDGRGVRFIDDTGELALTYSGLVALDALGKQLPARLARVEHGLALLVDERDARYPLTIDPIAQQQAYFKASNTGVGDVFGFAVAVSGDTIVIGAQTEDSSATGVNGNAADNIATNAGAAYVFVRSGTTWTQQAYLKASNTNGFDSFGDSVAIDGDTIVVGASWEDSAATGVNGNEASNSVTDAGAAYVFVRSGTTWSQQAYLKASHNAGTLGTDEFGFSVDISGDTIVVGSQYEDSSATGVNGDATNNSAAGQGSGAACVFVRSGTTWTQQAYLKASNTGAGDEFGWSVSISGDTIVVGGPDEDSNSTGVDGDQINDAAIDSGSVYVFVRSGTTWSQQAYLKASNTGAGDRFGQSVSVSGDTALVGADSEGSDGTGVNGNQSNDLASHSGAAYLFVRSGTTWSQQAYLKASNTDVEDRFGWSVAVSGDTALIGAYAESGNGTGVNGNQSNDSSFQSGAAYLFWRNGVVWNQQAYLKSSNTGIGDWFGWSVAISNNDLLVGAQFEDSSAIGVNGNQNNNAGFQSGAAYLFVLEPPAFSYFCSGDGSLPTPCPCALPDTVPAPPAAPGHGCANSLNLNGALLTASGRLSPDTLKLTAQVAPLYVAFALLLKGNASDGNGVASSDGIRCVDGALLRFGSHFAATNGDPIGQWSYPNAVQTTPISAATLQTPGQTAYYQLFYRNAAPGFCTAATANWSSGVIVPWP